MQDPKPCEKDYDSDSSSESNIPLIDIKDFLKTKDVVFQDLNLDSTNCNVYEGSKLSKVPESLSADDNNSEPFQQLAKSMVDITENGGVLKKIIKEGSGSLPVDKALIITIHYNYYLEFADEPSDSTTLRNRPFRFRINNSETTIGLDIAVKGMKLNEQSQFLISPEYAYGEMGCPPRIPPQSTLLFDVTLLDFAECNSRVNMDKLTREEMRDIPLPDVLDAVKGEIRAGFYLSSRNDDGGAMRRLRKGRIILDKCFIENEEEEQKMNKVKKKLYLNLAACCINLKKYPVVLSCCQEVLRIDGRNLKALVMRAKGKEMLHDYHEALSILERAGRIDSSCVEVKQGIPRLQAKIKKQYEEEKIMSARMLGLNKDKKSETTAKSNASATSSTKSASISKNSPIPQSKKSAPSAPSISNADISNKSDTPDAQNVNIERSPLNAATVLNVQSVSEQFALDFQEKIEDFLSGEKEQLLILEKPLNEIEISYTSDICEKFGLIAVKNTDNLHQIMKAVLSDTTAQSAGCISAS